MFADRARIFIRSGKGGDGHVSFRRELYVPDGGPDGGDGGKGGDLIFVVDPGLNTLVDYRHKRKYCAGDGKEGSKKRCTGASGEDMILKVPAGTVVKDAETGKVILDMANRTEPVVLLKGGRGGKGNQHYATATMQAPKYAQPGQRARELWVDLELKVIADVGLIGFPNVGKSTLLSRVTNARPKIANYHFTTLNPNLGVVDLAEGNGFVIMIECITLSDTGSEVTLVCNDEGKLLGLPLNRPLWDGADVLAGPGFLAGCDNEGNLTSLPQSTMDFYKEKFRAFIIEI